jgi:RNA-binding protein
LVVVRVTAVDDVPPIGTAAVDESLSEVGRIVDVFGPVDRPYLAVSPVDHVRLPDLLGTKLYAR